MKLENKILIKVLIVVAAVTTILTCSCTSLTHGSSNYKFVAWCTESTVYYFTDAERTQIDSIPNHDSLALFYGDVMIERFPYPSN